jgi:hypothetical protein
MNRREFLKGVVALVAGGILPVSGVQAAWGKLPSDEKPVSSTERQISVSKEERFGNEFEREFLAVMAEEIAKEMDRAIIEDLLAVVQARHQVQSDRLSTAVDAAFMEGP